MRVPPVLWLGAAALAQRLVGSRPTPVSTAASLPLVGVAGWLLGGSVQEFVRRGTTVDPVSVERASTLVRTGPNAVTRNPMYLGMATLLTAHAVARRSPLALLPVVGLVAVLDRWQVPAEERALTRLEGYDDYVARVPRWL